MRIFITGATGFIGSYISEMLLERGHEIAVLLRPGADTWRIAAHLARLQAIAGDLAATPAFAPALRDFHPDTVIHCAWNGVGNAARNDTRQVDNVVHATSLVKVAHEAGATCFIGFGSQAEYGPRSDKTNERAALNPTTAYGAAKAAAYYLSKVLCEQGGLRFCWARLFSTYGPKDEAYWMVPQLILRLLDGEKPALTEGRQNWDYCHARDVACAVAALAESANASGAFNIGAGTTMTVREIAEMIRDAAAPGSALGFGEVAYRPDQVMHLEADIARIRDATGWLPRIPLRQGLAQTVDWYRSERARYATPR